MVLQLRDVTKRFGANIVADESTLALDRPRMVGVIGRSGADKSTLPRTRSTDSRSPR